MKKPLFLLLTLFWTLPAGARAQEKPRQLGAGAYIGIPFGFSAKYMVTSERAVAAALGAQDDDFDMHVDALAHLRDLIPDQPAGKFPVHLGLGFKIRDETDTLFGFRFVAGLAYLMKKHPLEIFGEVAPVFRVAPDLGSAFDGGVGVRYYFDLAGK